MKMKGKNWCEVCGLVTKKVLRVFLFCSVKSLGGRRVNGKDSWGIAMNVSSDEREPGKAFPIVLHVIRVLCDTFLRVS